MKNILEFFIEVGKLKGKKRRGMMFYGIKDPETTAEHTYRTAIVGWFLGTIKKLDIKQIIKMSLVHDLCEVYAGDITPYDGLLPKDKKERYKFVRKWPHLSEKQKKKRYFWKLKKEKKSLEKLIKKLPPKIKNEILSLWWDHEIGISKEGRFVRQIDKTENLIEAFDCWKRDKKFPTKPWWQHADEVIDDPLILKFLTEIEIEELRDKKAKRNPRMKNLLIFFSEIGKLKRMTRRGWVLKGVKNPDSIAEHTFQATIIAWVLGEQKGGFDIERLLKIALIHDLSKLNLGNTTCYVQALSLPKSKKELKELMDNCSMPPVVNKKKIDPKKFKQETRALEKLILKLPPSLKKEIKDLWIDYKKGLTPEGRFFKQINRMESFFQAWEYWKKYKKVPLKPWCAWYKEFSDDPILYKLSNELNKKFHKKKESQI